MDYNQMNNENNQGETTWQEMPYQQSSEQPAYGYQEPVADTKDGLCTASLVLGIVGFFFNPLYVCPILAIVFGVIGMKAEGPKVDIAKIGMILGIVSMVFQFIVDIFLSIFTFGGSFCC